MISLTSWWLWGLCVVAYAVGWWMQYVVVE
jgi:hypothetical protein